MSCGKSESLNFDMLLLLTAYKVSAKVVQKISLVILKSDPNFEQKFTFCLWFGEF